MHAAAQTRRFDIRLTMLLVLLLFPLRAAPAGLSYPQTPRIAVRDTLHGSVLIDDYRWLEDADDPRVAEWTRAQVALTRSILDALPQRAHLVRRFNELWRYDDEGVPGRVLDGERLFYWAKQADQEKWTYRMKEHDGAAPVTVLDPNRWPDEETLNGATPSRNGRYVAFGKALGGDETPVVRVLDLETGALLPDSLRGWKQHVDCWLPDNSGFFYSAKPAPGSVAAGEEHYWHAVYLHRLGTPAAADRRIFADDLVKEYYHGAEVSEDGRFMAFYRWNFSRNEVYLQRLGSAEPPIPLATGFDGQYAVTFVEDQILIHTDASSPLGEVFVTDIERPEREHWRVFIPAEEGLKLGRIAPIAGQLYVSCQADAHSLIRIYDLAGRHLRDLPLPMVGSAWVRGHWSQEDIWVSFASFTYPTTIFRYDFAADRLDVYRAFPLEIDVDAFTAEQVWYPSRDGTDISMFLVHRQDLLRNGDQPVLLTGYGGFDSSQKPYFSTSLVAWLEAGGMVAIPNLRGGGEYGREWHEAGMRERKQNVFDDFIAAAEWLIEGEYTRPERLAISGGSNGGLLVGAVAMQRPDLFGVVRCAVPLLDMLRYHKFGLANIWAEEYGSAEDPDQFRYLRAYSPYHNVDDGTGYPTMLITGSENDARVDPLHARKMVARLQAANPDGQPILLQIHQASGHGGGTTLATKIEQSADGWAFLMHALGMPVPE